MGRPKGALQKNRNKSKYILPNNVTLVVLSGQENINYNKTTRLLFLDSKYGEFFSTFKAIIDANASTHPEAIKKRRNDTNIEKYGFPNAGSATRAKAQETMLNRYGVLNILENPEYLKKSRETLKKNFNVNNPIDVPGAKEKQQNTILKKYGVVNPMQNIAVWEKHQKAMIKNGTTFESKGERDVKAYIESLNFTTTKGYYKEDNQAFQIDILINELPIAVEYNGNYWHSEICPRITQQYHLNKTKLMMTKSIKLLHIFEYEWVNRNSQVKSFLRSALGRNQIKIYGRNTKVQEVPKDQAKNFLNDYHILGECNFIKAFGLYKDDELLALITIGKHHRNNNEFILSRYVGKENTTVIGGLSKLTEAAYNEYKELYTWIDLRWSDGKNWLNNNWNLVHTLKPDYCYWSHKTNEIISKQSRKKSVVNTPNGMTEHQHALSDKLYRIYDCGKLKLKYR